MAPPTLQRDLPIRSRTAPRFPPAHDPGGQNRQNGGLIHHFIRISRRRKEDAIGRFLLADFPSHGLQDGRIEPAASMA